MPALLELCAAVLWSAVWPALEALWSALLLPRLLFLAEVAVWSELWALELWALVSLLLGVVDVAEFCAEEAVVSLVVGVVVEAPVPVVAEEPVP